MRDKEREIVFVCMWAGVCVWTLKILLREKAEENNDKQLCRRGRGKRIVTSCASSSQRVTPCSLNQSLGLSADLENPCLQYLCLI